MAKQVNNIIDTFLSNVGLFEKVFGKLLPSVVWDQRREGAKNLLKNIYKMEDIDILFNKSLDRKEFTKQSKILFQVFDPKIDEKN